MHRIKDKRKKYFILKMPKCEEFIRTAVAAIKDSSFTETQQFSALLFHCFITGEIVKYAANEQNVEKPNVTKFCFNIFLIRKPKR